MSKRAVSVWTEELLRNLAREYVYGGFKSYTEFSEYKGYERSSTEVNSWFSGMIKKHPTLKGYIDEFVRERIKVLASRALQVETDLMNSAESENVRLSAAKDILSRGGYDPVAKQEISTNEITISIGEPIEDKS